MNEKREKTIFTTDEAGTILGLDGATVRRYCREGRLGEKVGRDWLVTRAQLDEFAATPRPMGRPTTKGN